jgi:hypothetical protein
MTDAPTIYQLTHAGTAPLFNAAFAAGCGGVIVNDAELRPGAVALWGEHKFYKTLNRAIAEGRNWYYGDHAYFGRQFFYRVTKNALQADGHFWTAGPAYSEAMQRFEQVSEMLKAHRTHDEIAIRERQVDPRGFVLVCPPSEPQSERSGFTQAQWIERVVRKLTKATRRDIVIRQKPPINHTPAPLLKALQGAWAAVTFTSNVATEAMLGGYPCFTTGLHPANVFGNTDLSRIERPFLPPRKTLHMWAATLCCNQWTLDEIRRGECWITIQ